MKLSARVINGEIFVGTQHHFHMETHVCILCYHLSQALTFERTFVPSNPSCVNLTLNFATSYRETWVAHVFITLPLASLLCFRNHYVYKN